MFYIWISFFFIASTSVPEDESVQLISEVWIEPQDGVVTKEGHDWDEVVGVTFDCLPKIIFPKDNEVISCLLTCEHLSLMCQKRDTLGKSIFDVKFLSLDGDFLKIRWYCVFSPLLTKLLVGQEIHSVHSYAARYVKQC